jgi:hypothetical protein
MTIMRGAFLPLERQNSPQRRRDAEENQKQQKESAEEAEGAEARLPGKYESECPS